MRILQLVQKPQRRGAEVFAFQLSRELRRQAHAVKVLYLYPYRGRGALSQNDGENLNGCESSLLEKAPGIEPKLLRRLLTGIDGFRPDIVQVNGARTVKYGAFAAMARPNRSWALVYRNIGNPRDWVTSPVHRAYYRRIVMPRLDGVVGVSMATLEIVREFYGLSIPMTQIPRGVDPALLAPTKSRQAMRRAANTPDEAPVLIYVGSLTPEKRLDRLIRMLPHLLVEHPTIRIWIVGDGPLRAQLHDQVRKLGFSHAVQFHGVQENVADYLLAADLFVLTSDTEGMPGVLLEAGYMGLPVVATKVGGVHECVVDGETGVLVAPDDEQGLAAAVKRLLHDEALRRRMGSHARQWVCERFTMDSVAVQYEHFYRRLVRS